ncbi:hypothetical protein Arcve_1258 [Archaeoglobus veneficus SNP6]|uniref:Uncharacterized protein n=1 Tax=Archaeoglobus veneficus (strain DSM 11195 / SNP6) TaxID=693661 RepID=F2KMY9_ARCVS|nr:hypothetical protein Arcve_1258 [Archaeoglobus veneficus SNP6]
MRKCKVCGNKAYFAEEGGRLKCQICGQYLEY